MASPADAPDCAGREPLMEFKEVFNFDAFVKEQLVPAETEAAESSYLAALRSSAHLIGQERDGGVLFAWDVRAPRSAELSTHVGWFSQASPAFRTLYRHSSRADICSASVNFERTLLAFTVRSLVEGGKVVYESKVAELQPQGRVFDLELRSSEYRKAQFVWPEVATPRSRTARGQQHQSSRLLLIVPDVFLVQYSFKMQQIGGGIVLDGQPTKEIVAEHFSWYQWDPAAQWFYHAKFERSSTPVQASMSGRNSLMLACISFSGAAHQLVFLVALPLPYHRHIYSGARTYYSSLFGFTVPVREMNLQVLHRREGYWCACLQHCAGVLPPANASFPAEELDAPSGSKVDYSVYIIHNGYVVYGQVPLAVPLAEECHVHFMLLSHFLVAYVPGLLLHLLNIGPRTDPCHHLAFGPADTPPFPAARSVGVASRPVLSVAVSTPFLSDYHSALVDCSSGVVYECSLNTRSFLQLFKACRRPELREDLLHLMVVCFRDHGRALSMIEHVCQTPMELVDHRLFAEFIVASSFANVHFDCNRFVAKQLPLTIAPSFRGRVVKNADGSKLAWLKLTPMPNFLKQLQVQSEQTLVEPFPELLFTFAPREDQPCDHLCFLVLTCDPDIARINMSARPSHTTPPSPSRSGAALRRGDSRKRESRDGSSAAGRLLGTLTKLTRQTLGPRGVVAQPSPTHGDMLSFLEPDEDLSERLSREASDARDHLLSSITRNLSLKSKNAVQSTVSAYFSEVQRHSAMLLFLVWTSLELGDDAHPLSLPLNRLPSPREQVAFELLEAYQLALLELGVPPPSGFHTLFTALGYLCLQPALFLQYLHNGVLLPTQRFVSHLLEEKESVEESILFQVLAFMEPALAEEALRGWDCPAVRLLAASKST